VGAVGQRLPDGTIATFPASGATSFGGLEFVPAPLPNEGDLLVSNYTEGGQINSHSLTDNGDGTFAPVLEGLYLNSFVGRHVTGLHFIPTGVFKNDLMITDWSNRTVEIIDIDPTTGTPVGGGGSPTLTRFATGDRPHGLEFDPITGNLFISNYNIGGGVTDFIIQISGFPPPLPELACSGFLPPFDQPLSLKKKVKRAIPVDMVLTDADGFTITDTDIVAPPVINVLFGAQVYGVMPPDTDDLLPLGSANDDNIFRFDIDSWQWIYNLGTKQFTAAGTYTVTVASGDETEYTIDTSGGQCTQTFVRLP